MTSGKQAKRRRKVQAPPPPVRGAGRQASPKVLAGAAGAVALVALAVALALVFSRGSSSSSSTSTIPKLPDAGFVARLFEGIPQQGNILGSPRAPVTMVEYIDLQCPVCRAFETQVMPSIFSRYVRTGKVKIVARPIAFIGPDSVRGLRAALAAQQQNRLFNFAQLLYFNQGTENTGWLTDAIVRSAAASVAGLIPDALVRAAGSSSTSATEKQYAAQATAAKVVGTPGIFVGKSGGSLRYLTPGTSPDTATLEAAFKHAAR